MVQGCCYGQGTIAHHPRSPKCTHTGIHSRSKEMLLLLQVAAHLLHGVLLKLLPRLNMTLCLLLLMLQALVLHSAHS